jgi:excisionase family DNA binding protein
VKRNARYGWTYNGVDVIPSSFHTVSEVALTLDVSSKPIARRIREGVIRKVPMGGRLVRISSAELERLAAAGDHQRGAVTRRIINNLESIGTTVVK